MRKRQRDKDRERKRERAKERKSEREKERKKKAEQLDCSNFLQYLSNQGMSILKSGFLF